MEIGEKVDSDHHPIVIATVTVTVKGKRGERKKKVEEKRKWRGKWD